MPFDILTGNQLARLLRAGSDTSDRGDITVGGSGTTICGMEAAVCSTAPAAIGLTVVAARRAELKHELIALLDGKLTLNWANFEELRSRADPEAPTLVVSFLGDTSVGKSTIIRELIGEGAGERPFVQRSTEQSASTTYNVNMYTSNSVLSGFNVQFLDYEGESGSAEPVMTASTSQFAARAAFTGALTRTGKGRVGWGNCGSGELFGARSVSNGTSGGVDFVRVARGVPDVACASRTALALPAPSSSEALNYASLAAAVLPLSGSVPFAGALPAPTAATAQAPSILSRAQEVRECFPRLSYCVSDIVVLVGVEKLYSSRYLERALLFAKQANTNIQDVELPVLIIINNKEDVDACEFDIKKTSLRFAEMMGRDFQQLDLYFSSVLVYQLPNSKTAAVRESDGIILNGRTAFADQIRKLRELLRAVLNTRKLERDGAGAMKSSGCGGSGGSGAGPGRRLITSRQGLWYSMLPRIVAKLNGGETVHVTRLLDEAWAESMRGVLSGSEEAPLDAFKALFTHLRPPAALSERAARAHEDYLSRFERFYALSVDVIARVVAARLRCMDRALLLDERLRRAVMPQLEGALALLADLVPCRAVYGAGHSGPAIQLGTPMERACEPVLCLQERRVHRKGHRAARRVKGGGPDLWRRLANLLPYNPTWPGPYQPAQVQDVDALALADDVVELVGLADAHFAGPALQALQDCHSSSTVRVTWAPLQDVSWDIAKLPADTASHDVAEATAGPLRLQPQESGRNVPPYCAGCGRRCANGSEARVASGSGVVCAAHGRATGMFVDADGDSTGAGEGSYHSWVTALIADVIPALTAEAKHALGLAGGNAERVAKIDGGGISGVVSFDSRKPAAAGAGAMLGARRGGLKRAQDVASDIAGCEPPVEQLIQVIVLGLCRRCWQLAAAYNNSTSNGPDTSRRRNFASFVS